MPNGLFKKKAGEKKLRNSLLKKGWRKNDDEKTVVPFKKRPTKRLEKSN